MSQINTIQSIINIIYMLLFAAGFIAFIIKGKGTSKVLGSIGFGLLIIIALFRVFVFVFHLIPFNASINGVFAILEFAAFVLVVLAIFFIPKGNEVTIQKEPASVYDGGIDASEFPKAWIGFVLAGVNSLFAIIDLFAQSGYGTRTQSWSFIFLLAASVYYYIFVYRIHKICNKVTNDTYSISPGKAVGFHFIPIYNYIWFFKWTGELAKLVNSRNPERPMSAAGPGILLLLSMLLIFVIIPTENLILFAGGLLQPFALFGILFYIEKKLRFVFCKN